MKKRLFALILTIALLFCSAISIYASPASYTCTLKDGAVMRKVQTNEGILVTVSNEGFTSVAKYDPSSGEFEMSLYDHGRLTVHRTGNLMDRGDSVTSTKSINTKEDRLFGYSYYYNTDAAYGDFYWRLNNPDSDVQKKYFFTDSESINQSYALNFADEVKSMITAQNTDLVYAAIEGLLNVDRLVGNVTQSGGRVDIRIAVEAAVGVLDLLINVIDPMTDAYVCALNANAWFDFIDETVRPQYKDSFHCPGGYDSRLHLCIFCVLRDDEYTPLRAFCHRLMCGDSVHGRRVLDIFLVSF